MTTYTAVVAVVAPRESVWRVLSDVVAWPDWLSTVDSVQALDASDLHIGFRYVVRQPGLRPTTWVVTQLDPPDRFVWQARSPGLSMVAEHIIEEDSPGECNVTLRFSFAGLLGVPLGRLLRSITQQYLGREAACLKGEAERHNERSLSRTTRPCPPGSSDS